MIENDLYMANGFQNREQYLDHLKEEYEADKVDLLSQILGPSEDFDGLLNMLEGSESNGI